MESKGFLYLSSTMMYSILFTKIVCVFTFLLAETSLTYSQPVDSSEYHSNTPEEIAKRENVKLLKEVEDRLKTDPKSLDLLLKKGVLEEKLDQEDNAKATYKMAIKHHPNSFQPYYGLAALYHNKGAALDGRYLPSDPQLLEQLRKEREKAFDKAIPLLERAHEIKPTDIIVIKTLVTLYAHKGDEKKYKVMKAKLKD
jgi:tetratricopeptide (TPR) repeat protein